MKRRFLTLAFGAVVAASPVARPARAQDAGGARITGRVTATETGAPLEAASVLIEALSVTARVSPNGTYSVVVPPARVSGQSIVIRARAIGYFAESRTVTLSAGTITLDFALRQDINKLEEIVVTGTVTATSQKKLPFSAVTLSAADIPIPSVSALTALQAKVPGAHIVQPSGRPGQAPAILLRGPKSINASGRSQDPLVIVDGAILNGSTSDLNPDDIENIEIIRGASGSTLYGSRAGAGVIQITTKSALRAPNGSRFTLRSELGYNDVQREYQYASRHFLMMNETYSRPCVRLTQAQINAGVQPCQTLVDIDAEVRRMNDTASAGALNPQSLERDYNIMTGPPNATGMNSMQDLKGLFQVNHWPRLYNPIAQIVTNGRYSSNTLDMTAKSGATAYYASFARLGQVGAFRFLKGYERDAIRVNADQSVTDQLSLSLSSSFAKTTQYPAGGGLSSANENGSFFSLTRVAPMVNLLQRDHLGRLFVRTNILSHGQQDQNPLYNFENTQDRVDVERIIGSLTARYAPFDWLALDGVLSTDRRRNNETFFRDRGYRTTSNAQVFTGGTGDLRVVAGSDIGYNGTLSARANRKLGANLKSTVTARYTFEQQTVASTFAGGTDLAVPGLATLGNVTANLSNTSSSALIKAIGAISGVQLDWKDKVIVDGLYRYDGSSLFGANERWHPYWRTSVAWRASEELFWPAPRLLSDFKLRASVGTAGGRPNIFAQYETYTVASGGVVTASTLGNKDLKPEQTLETELGADVELRSRFGLSFTYARDVTTDQLMLVNAPAASGYPSQWDNIGTLDGKTYELSLRLPIKQSRAFGWTAVLNWDRNRTYITELNIPPFVDANRGSNTGTGLRVLYAPGVRYGTIVGKKFARSCSDLPAPFDQQCGPNKEWQANDEGWIVWVGAGRSWKDGVTDNLWQAVRPGCVNNGTRLDVASAVACTAAGGTINTPWGLQDTHWGMPTIVRDSNANPLELPLGNSMPDFRIGMSHDVRYKRLRLYGLADISVGSDIFHEERQWSYGDLAFRDNDQVGKSVETAKPIGYYWRASRPGIGVGGFYDAGVAGTNLTIEDGSYVKLREVTLSFDLGGIKRACECSIAVIGRNLYTWTRFTGWDPEVGVSGGSGGSAAIQSYANFQYPQMRTFTFTLTARL